MNFSTILLLILTISICICAYILLALNTNIVQIDLLIKQYDVELGKLILVTFLGSMIVTLLGHIFEAQSLPREAQDPPQSYQNAAQNVKNLMFETKSL